MENVTLFDQKLKKEKQIIKFYYMKIELITQEQFEELYNEKRRQTMPSFFKKTFPLYKSKVLIKSQRIYEPDQNGVPTLIMTIPGKSKRVFDTNKFNELCQAVWEYYTGNKLKRISSEGKYRVGIGYIPTTNKGFSDLHGMYEGRAVYIETKQRNEKHLKSQRDFIEWVRSGGGIYATVRSFEDMYIFTIDLIRSHSSNRNG